MTELACSLLWRRLGRAGLEHFRMWEGEDGPRLAGTVLLDDEGGGAPWEARYEVACSPAWETRYVRVELARGAGTRRLELAVDAAGHWRVDGEPRDDLAGCVDVDLSATPSTNTLPIRRLGPALGVGEGRETTAAWVRFPQLRVETLPQRYTRLDERRWLYESGGGSFVAELEVDEAGVVTRYAGGWERAADG